MNEFAQLRERSGYSVNEVAELLGKSSRTIYRWEKGEVEPTSEIIKFLSRNKSSKAKHYSGFRFIDLFAGIGGLRRGFENIGGECVFTCEWDKYARQTYQANFDCSHPIAGDIRDVNLKSIPEHDVLLGGWPCQPFSIAGVSKKTSLGKQHGFNCETQGTLFFDLAQIIDHHRPKAFLLENVKNLLSHDKGNTFEVVRRTLTEELGYTIDYKVIDAKSWVPQHRERIYIVGFRENLGFSFDDVLIPDVREGPKLNTILHKDDSFDIEEPYTDSEGKVSNKYTLSDKLWLYLQNYAKKHKEKGNGFGFGLFGPEDVARTLSARYYKDGSEILIKQGGKNPRRLTPRECARLMGFDSLSQNDRFTIPVSDTQAYKQFGNSVAVPVIELIARQMTPYIDRMLKNNKRVKLAK